MSVRVILMLPERSRRESELYREQMILKTKT